MDTEQGRAQRASVDNSPWDGPAAMSAAGNSDSPAAAFKSICAGRRAGDPSLAKTWALPHHKHPGGPPNAAGVRNSLSRLPQTQGLTNKADAHAHLEHHMTAIKASNAATFGADYRERRAAAASSRAAVPNSAARVAGFGARFRRETVTHNGKELARLDGYASVVDMPYEMWDMFGPYTESVGDGAFERTLAAKPDVAFLMNHKGMTMARTANGTLLLDADPRGLHSLAYVNPERTDVRDMLTAIEDGDITEMSFAFMITEGGWDEDFEHFTISAVDLDRGDVSAVNYGANPHTSIAARCREVLADIDHLPEGAQRAALASLAQRFGPPDLTAAAASARQPGTLETDDNGDPILPEGSAVELVRTRVNGDQGGRSVELMRQLLELQ